MLHNGAQLLELCHFILPCLLFLLILLQLQTFFRDADELFAIKFFKLGDGIFINRIDKQAFFLRTSRNGESRTAAIR
jgi:hypothetical protein